MIDIAAAAEPQQIESEERTIQHFGDSVLVNYISDKHLSPDDQSFQA